MYEIIKCMGVRPCDYIGFVLICGDMLTIVIFYLGIAAVHYT